MKTCGWKGVIFTLKLSRKQTLLNPQVCRFMFPMWKLIASVTKVPADRLCISMALATSLAPVLADRSERYKEGHQSSSIRRYVQDQDLQSQYNNNNPVVMCDITHQTRHRRTHACSSKANWFTGLDAHTHGKKVAGPSSSSGCCLPVAAQETITSGGHWQILRRSLYTALEKGVQSGFFAGHRMRGRAVGALWFAIQNRRS